MIIPLISHRTVGHITFSQTISINISKSLFQELFWKGQWNVCIFQYKVISKHFYKYYFYTIIVLQRPRNFLPHILNVICSIFLFDIKMFIWILWNLSKGIFFLCWLLKNFFFSYLTVHHCRVVVVVLFVCLRQTLTLYLWIASNRISGPSCTQNHWECLLLMSMEIKGMCHLPLSITHFWHYVYPLFYVTIRNSFQKVFRSLKTMMVPFLAIVRNVIIMIYKWIWFYIYDHAFFFIPLFAASQCIMKLGLWA